MRFNIKKHKILSTLFISMTILTSSCGILGSKNKPADGNNKVGGAGCLDNSKDLVGRYLSGKMEKTEWKSSFDCINQSLDFFTQYVHGSTEDAYSQGDMYTLISRFLITNHPVNRDLMRGAFNLKQALFGGDAAQFTKTQIELLKSALTRLEGITADLIPYLKIRQDPNATYEELLEMAAAFKIAGDQISDYVSSLPRGDLSDQALGVLIEQLTSTLGLPVVDGLNTKIFLAKWMMFNTRRDAIEAQDWPQFFRAGLTLGGVALAFNASTTLQNPDAKSVMDRFMNDYRYREFIWKLALQTKPSIEESLTKHEGNTPLPLFDHLIDEIPPSVLGGLHPDHLKEMLRPLTRRMLMSSGQMGVDQGVIDTVFNLVDNLVQDLGLLDRFYEKANLDIYDVQPDTMQTLAAQFESGLSGADKTRFTAIKNTIFTYKPLFYRDTGSILYQNGVGYTRFQNVLVVALDRVLKHMLRTYGSGDGYFVEGDFTAIFEEPAYQKVLNELNWVDATVPRFGAKRFQDMDLFTPVSDGNQQVSLPEAINYAMMIVSSGKLTTKMRNEITPRCDQNLGQDLMGWTWIPTQCFRNEFYKKLPYWLTYFPHVKAYWESLSVDDQNKAAIWLEHGSRRNGYGEENNPASSGPVGKFDFGASAAVLHYTETLFTRFDADGSDLLSKSELGYAFPVFKTLIHKKQPMLSSDYLLKGVFTYIVKYRAMPQTTNINTIAKLGWWLAIYSLPTTKYSADRGGVFNIVCQLAGPENFTSVEADALNARICAP